MVGTEEAKSIRSTIEGGFVLVSIASLMACWRACQSATLGIGDFRAWLACHEIVARRCAANRDRSPTYAIAELARLLGVSERSARASLRRLGAAGLIEWSPDSIRFPEPPTRPAGLDNTIGGGKGSVAIPRRMLKFLVEGARVSLIAVALAVLLRCLSRRRGGWDGWGRVKASWIARAFDVDLGRVKLARAELVQLGWIAPESSEQWTMNRYGKAYRIDLGWNRPGGCETIPPRPADRRETIPPDSDQEPFQERNQNQEPAKGPTGFCLQGSETQNAPTHPTPVPTLPTPTTPTSANLPAPTLRDIHVEDLKDTERLLGLHDQAVEQKLVGASEADRLKFVAAAEHAVAIGKANPCGLFAYLVRGACWRYITQADEDRANTRIKAYLRGPALPSVATKAPVRPTLSEDALLVLKVRSALASAGYRGDPFPQVRRHDPSWTRERWDAALAELGL
jgi:hypothetical protein